MFSHFSQLQKLDLPSTLSSFEQNAFAGTNLTSIRTNNSLVLKTNCFNEMRSLRKVAFYLTPNTPDDLGLNTCTALEIISCLGNSIGTFSGIQTKGTSARVIAIGDAGKGVTEISQKAFENCNNLTAIDLSKSSITDVQASTFYNCHHLISVFLPNTITSYSNNCFYGCNELFNVGIDYSTIKRCENVGTDNIKAIGIDGSKLQYIGDNAFKGLNLVDSFGNTITSLTIDRIEHIGQNAFEECELQNIQLNFDNSVTKTIPVGCFQDSTSLQKFSTNASSIANNAFANCAELTSFHSDVAITSIGDNAFNACVSLNSFSFESLKTLGQKAFQSTGITLAKFTEQSITIGQNAFLNAINLTSIEFTSKPSSSFNSVAWNNIREVVLTSNYISDYYSNPINWHNKDSINLAYNSLMNFFFTGCSNNNSTAIVFKFKDVDLRYDGIRHEYNCLKYSDLEKHDLISVDPGVDDFTQFASYGILPDTTQTVAYDAFNSAKNNSQLTSLDFANTITFGNGSLANATYLTLVLAPHASIVPQAMLSSSTNLKSIDFHLATSIEISAFCNCQKMIEFINGLDQVTSINSYAFADCTSLTALPSMASLKQIGTGSFQNCKSLESINFSGYDSELTSIGANAFNGCMSLTSIVVPHGVASLASNVFNSCTSIKEANIFGTTTIASGAMASWRNDLSVKFFGKTQANVISEHSIVPNSDGIANSSTVGTPKQGAKLFTTDNAFSHPTFIAISPSQIYIVKHPSFEVTSSRQLLSVDPNWESTELNQDHFVGIASVSTASFKNTQKLERLQLLESFFTALPDGIFSVANAGSVWYIRLKDATLPSESTAASIFVNKLGRNSKIEIHYDDGYIKAGIIYRTDDPFLYDSSYNITGVDEDKARLLVDGKVNKIDNSHKQIKGYSLQYTAHIKSIDDFNNVVTIDDNAFYDNASITSLNLKNSTGIFNSIGEDAFTRAGVTNITVDISQANGSQQIGGYGLQHAVNLQKITYGSKVKAIAPSAMVDAEGPLSCIHFDASLTSIGNAAFAELYERFPRIEDVNLSACTQLNTIGDYAFFNAIKDQPEHKLIFPISLLSIGDAAFAYRNVSWTQQLSALGQVSEEVGSVQMHHVKHIGVSAFINNTFKDVELGTDLTSIGDYAFAYPKYRFKIKVPGSILANGTSQTVGDNAFKENVILNPNNIMKNIAEFGVKLNQLPTIFGAPMDAEFQAENKQGFTDATVISATRDGNWLQSFAYVLDNKVNYCPQYLSIDIINRALANVSEDAITAYVPSYISCISSQAFMDCQNLTSISAEIGLSIGLSAFANCINLREIVSGRDDYHAALPYYIGGIIPDAAFYNCQNLNNILFLSTLQSIGASAFYNCNRLTSLFDKDTLDVKADWILSSIGDYAFANCSNLSAFDIPASIFSIGIDVFKSCRNLQNINFDISHEEFAKLAGFIDIKDAIIDKFDSINSEYLDRYGKTRINFIDVTYMNNGIIKIDNEFIEGCTLPYTQDGKQRVELTAIKYDDFAISAQSYLNLSAISKVRQFVFSDISKLRAISFLPSTDPSNSYCLEEIGDFAFSGCYNLMSINGGTLACTKIGTYAFANCEKLLQLKLSYPELIGGSIGQGAFYGTSLNKLEIINCPPDDGSQSNYNAYIVGQFKDAINYSLTHNQNPLEIPQYCIVYFYDINGNLVGKYDSMMHDLMHASIDTNRNAITFVNKEKTSITPLLLVKPVDGYLPAIATNTFHANIIGRWK